MNTTLEAAAAFATLDFVGLDLLDVDVPGHEDPQVDPKSGCLLPFWDQNACCSDMTDDDPPMLSGGGEGSLGSNPGRVQRHSSSCSGLSICAAQVSGGASQATSCKHKGSCKPSC